MPVPQVFRAVRRGTAALNVLDLVEVAGQFAGCEALARRRSRHRSRQLARPERAVQPLPEARGITGGGLRSVCIGGKQRNLHEHVIVHRSAFHHYFSTERGSGLRASHARISSDCLPRIGWLRITLDSPKTRCFELTDTSSFGRLAFGRRLTALDSP